MDNHLVEMNWTNQELEIWIKAGLVPMHLLNPENYLELINFLRTNKEKLHACYKRNPEEDYYQMQVPPQSEWHNAPDIPVIDTRTGKVLYSLEMAEEFELCEGICLKIKAKELEDWKKETAEAKQLTAEQNKELKAFLSKYGTERPLSRKEIVTFLEEVRKPRKVQKYRQSGHLVDEKLKYSKQNQTQTLFDLISPDTKQKIEESTIEVKAEGIKLTPPENKIVHALNRILHENSQTRNSKAEDFYSGNAPSLIVPYGQNQEQKAAVLKFKPAELYKAYMGKDDYSGADITFINNVLHQLESKKVLIKYDRIKKTKKGKKEEILTDRIEDFQSLIKIILFMPDLTAEEKERLDSGDNSIRDAKGEIVIALNPIFTDQIDTKFIEFPIDTNRRLVIAAGGHNKVTASMQTLMEWMLRDLSAKRYKTEINEENLPYMLGLEKYVKQKRKKLLQERIEKDINAIINMGIILEVEKKSNSTGGIKWVFHLNKEYE
jgi:hypothetical protein